MLPGAGELDQEVGEELGGGGGSAGQRVAGGWLLGRSFLFSWIIHRVSMLPFCKNAYLVVTLAINYYRTSVRV